MPYTHADNAIARCLGPLSSGTLSVTSGRGAAFAAASPTADRPLALGVWRSASPPPIDSLEPDGSEQLVGAVLVTGVSGDTLAVSGAVPGYSLPTIQAGDWIADAPLAVHLRSLWTAVEGRPTTAAVEGLIADAVAGYVTSSALTLALGSYATIASLSSYATTSALTSGLAGKQATLTAGSISTSLLADLGVTTAKLNDKAVTYGKLADAAGAGVLGATGPGAHQLLAIGSGLSIVGGALTASGGGGSVTSVGLSVPAGLSVSGSPVTGSGTFAVTLGVAGMLKGSGGAFVAATAGTDYVAPAGLTSALASYVALTGAQTLYDKSTQSSGSGDQLKFLNTLGAPASGVDADGNEGAYDLSFLLAAGVDLIAGASASQTARWPGKIAEILIKANVNGASGGFTLKIIKGATTIATQAVVASNTSLVTIAAGSISDLAIAKGDVISATCETSPAPGTGVQNVEVYVKHSRRNR